MLEKYNSTILEWLITSGHEDQALKFWEELGRPAGVDATELRQHCAVKQAIENKHYSHALQLIDRIHNGEKEDMRTEAMLRICFAEVVVMINNHADPLQVITRAREAIVPLIDKLPNQELRTKYMNLLNSFTSLLVLPDSASPPGTSELRDEAKLKAWVLDGVQASFRSKTDGIAKLDQIIECYKVIADESVPSRV